MADNEGQTLVTPVGAPTPAPEPEPVYDKSKTTVPPDVRVRLRWNSADDRRVVIESTHRLPNKHLVYQELTPAQRQLVPLRYRSQNSHYQLDRAINECNETIPLQVWADAISAATIRGLAATSAIPAESVLGSLIQTGYLTMGGTIMKVTPVAHIGANKAMAAIKRQALDAARAEAESVKTAAQQWAERYRQDSEQAARTIIDNANRIKLEAQQLKEAAQREGRIVPPSWLAGGSRGDGANLPLKFRRNKWEVGMLLSLMPNSFEYQDVYTDPETGAVRNARLAWRGRESSHEPIKVFVWQPIEDAAGTYNPRSAYIDGKLSDLKYLPHMNLEGSCLGLADGPPLLNCSTALGMLQNSLTRVHNGVNFASLLAGPEHWRQAFKPWVPEELWVHLSAANWRVSMRAEMARLNQPLTPEQAVRTGVWTT